MSDSISRIIINLLDSILVGVKHLVACKVNKELICGQVSELKLRHLAPTAGEGRTADR